MAPLVAVAAVLTTTVICAPAGGAGTRTWSAAEDVSADTRSSSSERGEVAVARDGGVTAAWLRFTQGTGWKLFASQRSRPGSWTPPTLVSSHPVVMQGLHLAAATGGRAVLVWTTPVTADTSDVWEAHLSAGGWSTAERLGSTPQPDGVDVGTSANGAVAAVSWRATDGLRVARRLGDGAWQSARLVTRFGTTSHALAVGPRGTVRLVWRQSTRTGSAHVQSALITPNGRLTRAAIPRSPAADDDNIALAVDDRGRALVVYHRPEDQVVPRRFRNVVWSRSSPSGSWTRARLLGGRVGEDYGQADLFMRPGGRALLTYRSQYTGVMAARYGPGEGWTRPKAVLSFSRGWATPALTAAGTAYLVPGDPTAPPSPIVYALQRQGARWTAARRVTQGAFVDADTNGSLLVLLYFDPTLKARTLDLRSS